MDKVQRSKVEKRIVREADAMLRGDAAYVDFSAKFFGDGGLLAQLWDTEEERKQLVRSPLYRRLQADMARLRSKEAKSFDEEVERLSGRLTVVVPKSLHAALRSEAAREGVSLSELIRVKLGVPYRMTVKMLLQGDTEEKAA
jgi:predicted HicB family RNase H-like nuclease